MRKTATDRQTDTRGDKYTYSEIETERNKDFTPRQGQKGRDKNTHNTERDRNRQQDKHSEANRHTGVAAAQHSHTTPLLPYKITFS